MRSIHADARQRWCYRFPARFSDVFDHRERQRRRSLHCPPLLDVIYHADEERYRRSKALSSLVALQHAHDVVPQILEAPPNGVEVELYKAIVEQVQMQLSWAFSTLRMSLLKILASDSSVASFATISQPGLQASTLMVKVAGLCLPGVPTSTRHD